MALIPYLAGEMEANEIEQRGKGRKRRRVSDRVGLIKEPCRLDEGWFLLAFFRRSNLRDRLRSRRDCPRLRPSVTRFTADLFCHTCRDHEDASARRKRIERRGASGPDQDYSIGHIRAEGVHRSM